MVKGGKQANKAGKIGDEVGDSQQRLSRSAGVLHVKRKGKDVKVPLAEEFDGCDEVSGGEDCPLGELPLRIFSKADIPKDGRINIHSRVDRLTDIVEVLEGTTELAWIKDSPFGKLFDLPTRYCEFSGRLVHNLLCRSLITKRKHEMWFVFGGKPLRFSLKEFAMITGLNCNPLPSDAEKKRLQTPEEDDEDYWNYLIGKQKTMSIDGIVRMLKADRKLAPHKRMDSDRRLKLCLIVLVEGILCLRSSSVIATRETAEMLKDLDTFCSYPWGRESFELTMRMVSVGEKVKSIESLAAKLGQSHISNHGFTLAYQLLAIYTIPLLEKIIPVKDYDSYFYDPLFTGLAKSKPFHNSNILAAEESADLVVESLLSTGYEADDWDLTWDDEVDDPKVQTIIKGLETGFDFKPGHWKAKKMKTPRRQAKVKGKGKSGANMFAGVADADSLVLEGDKLMDDYLNRKHEFEVREMESLREGYRHLLIKALTINQACKEGAEEDRCDDQECRVYTPSRRVRGASDIEMMSSDDTDSDAKLSRKNTAKAKKRKAEGKRPQADDRSGSDREKKKSKPTENVDTAQGAQCMDPVGTSINRIVEEVEKVHGVGVDPVAPAGAMDTDGDQATPPGNKIDVSHVISPQPPVVSSGVERVEKSAEGANEPVVTEEPAAAGVVAEQKAPTETIDTSGRTPAAPAPTRVVGTDPIVSQKDLQRKTAAEFESTTDAIDSHGGDVDSRTDATEKLETGEGDRNYCSGNEDDDVAETANPNENVEEQQANPSRITRNRQAPKRYGQTPEEKLKAAEETEEEYDPLRPASELKKTLFYKALDSRKTKGLKVLGHDVNKAFFRELYKPKQHLNTEQMEALLSSVWSRRGAEMVRSKVAVMDMWFCQYLLQEHSRYCKARNPPVPFKWHPAIVNYVAGNVDNREGSIRWMADVDELYAPMNWGANHWVALNINLVGGTVNIFDCNQGLTSEGRVPKVMKPVLDVLPLILRDLVDPALEPPVSFDCSRVLGVTQNERAGDCGPLTVKFIEMDAQGISVEGISEEQVDELRIRYAVEVYECNGNIL